MKVQRLCSPPLLDEAPKKENNGHIWCENFKPLNQVNALKAHD